MDLRIAGTGRAVVFLHGCPTTPDLLDPIAARVATFAQSVSVSLPGYGKSPPLEGSWDLGKLHAAIEDALLARGIERASIVGFSGGAYHALALACRARVRVDAVVSLAGLLGLSPEEKDGFRQFAAGVLAGADLKPLAGPRFLSAHARTPENVAAVEKWLDATPRENLAAELLAFVEADDLTAKIRALAIPILARVGAEDVAAPPAKSEAIARAAARGALQILPGVGHALPIEDLEGTASAVAAALR